MKITNEKISELASEYAKDNFNDSPTAYYSFKEGMKQAINFIHCCKSDSEQLDADFINIVDKESHFCNDGKIIKR